MKYKIIDSRLRLYPQNDCDYTFIRKLEKKVETTVSGIDNKRDYFSFSVKEILEKFVGEKI